MVLYVLDGMENKAPQGVLRDICEDKRGECQGGLWDFSLKD